MILAAGAFACTAASTLASSRNVNGRDLVARQETAAAIADAVAVETYGEEVLAAERPLVAKREAGVWHVSGHFAHPMPGGVVEVWISPKDGRVIRMTHGK